MKKNLTKNLRCLLGLNAECFDLFEQIIQLAGFDISASYSLVDLRCNCLSERLGASLLQCVPLLSGQTTHVKLSASNAGLREKF
jgi:hypothetical protein